MALAIPISDYNGVRHLRYLIPPTTLQAVDLIESLKDYRPPRPAFGAFRDFSRVRSLERILAERRNVL